MITYQKKEKSNEEIFARLHPITREWFKNKFGTFSPPQKFAVPDIQDRINTLVSSPTGSGKTLSAFLTIIDELVKESINGTLEDRTYCLYISPLKALSNDIERNLNGPLKEITEIVKEKLGKKLDIRVGVRTGDTTPYQRSKMLEHPPHILITTPETLAILLATKKFRAKIIKIDWCIIDEIHSLADSKRGVHMSLSLERLNQLTDFTRIGLSATVAPLSEVARFLIGQGTAKDVNDGIPQRNCAIVDVQYLKKMDIKVLSPVKNFMDTSFSGMQRNMYKMLHNMIQEHKTTLIFTNTRSATERVVHTLKSLHPKKYGEHNIGAHHGSLSKTYRMRIESDLKEGKLKCVVSSTSLELGIDIGSIDLVILLGSPKSVARALQRIGRSGHKLHEEAKGRIIVLDRDDLVECGVLLKAALEKKIDRISIPKNALDVIVQHIYGMAISGPIHREEIYNILRRSYCYENLEMSEFNEIISYMAGEFAQLEERYVYAKIWCDAETGMIGSRSKMARVMYMTNIGTIPDTSGIIVKIGAESIGVIDESFLEKLHPGDVFVLGGSTYTFKYSRGMTAQVTSSAGVPPTVPSWSSESLPLSYDLALEIQKFRKYMEDKFKAYATSGAEKVGVVNEAERKKEIIAFIDEYLYVDRYGAEAIYEYFKEQYYYATIPHYKKIVIEHYGDSKKKYVIFHTLFGRRVNDVLSRAVAYVISKQQRKDVEIGINDNGFYLASADKFNPAKAMKSLHAEDLRMMMETVLEHTEILKRRFRHVASRSLMILRSYKGNKKTVGRQQMSSQLLISAVKRVDPNFAILREAKREVLEDLMDIAHASEVVDYVNKRDIRITEIHTDVPTPFAFNLIMQGYVDILRMEDRYEFLKRMHTEVLAKIGLAQGKKDKGKLEDIREDMMSAKREEDRLDDTQIELLEQTRALNIPTSVRMSVNDLIRGISVEHIGFQFFTYVQRNEVMIVERWPKKIANFTLAKKSEFFQEHFDYSTFWKEEEDQKIEDIIEERKLLKLDFERAALKIDLGANFRYEAFRLIDEESDGYSREFKEWLDGLLDGTVPDLWSTRLVRFLMKAREKI